MDRRNQITLLKNIFVKYETDNPGTDERWFYKKFVITNGG